MFYVHAGLPGISSGEIGTSAGGLQSHQRTQLPGWGCFTGSWCWMFSIFCKGSIRALCFGPPQKQESNKPLAKVILFKTALCFERKKERKFAWLKKQTQCYGWCSGFQLPERCSRSWLLAARPPPHHLPCLWGAGLCDARLLLHSVTGLWEPFSCLPVFLQFCSRVNKWEGLKLAAVWEQH